MAEAECQVGGMERAEAGQVKVRGQGPWSGRVFWRVSTSDLYFGSIALVQPLMYRQRARADRGWDMR